MEKPIKDFDDDELVSLAGSGMPVRQQHAQAELTRRLMESIRDFDKTTSSYSKRLVVLTGILILAAMFQLLAASFTLPFDLVNRTLIAATFLFALTLALWYLAPDRK